MLTGTIYIVSDKNVLKNLACDFTYKIMALVDTYESIGAELPQAAVASILLPPYAAISAEIDGDMNTFCAAYWEHLASKEADATICLMIAALVRGLNIVLYVPKDEASNLNFVNVFMQYVFNTYGITIGTDSIPFAYNRAYDAIVCSRMYFHDYISYQELFVAYPQFVPIEMMIVPKLAYDMQNIMGQLSSPEEYLNFFTNYKDRIKQNDNKFLAIPIRKGLKR